ncbi:MAG: hypothetical protein HPY50_12965 [Firmicutes bacterium]|nr:hypothetical protein [Bacillota bacterium]
MLVNQDRSGPKGLKRLILLLSFCVLALFGLLTPGVVLADSGSGLRFHGFYTYGSESELGAASKLDSIALTWGRIAKDWQGKIVFTSWAEPIGPQDGYPEFSAPPNVIPNLADIKALTGEKYLMVGAMDDNNQDSTSILIELLNLNDKQLDDQVIGPMVSYLSSNKAGIDFAGVAVDLEGLLNSYTQEAIVKKYGAQNSGLRDKYTHFLRQLDKKLGDKKMMVCLQPSTYFNGYDFAAIGQIADTAILMAHDYQHYIWGAADPDIPASAPYYLVKDALQRSLSSGLKPEKTMLAICLAGVKWTKDGKNWDQSNVSLKNVDNTLSGKNGKVLSVSPPSRYLPTYQWGGRSYDYRVGFADVWMQTDQGTVNNRFYYENDQSLKEKLDLAQSNNLLGISLWRLGLGNQVAWDTLLEGHEQLMFTDLAGHWARVTIEELAKADIVKGVSGRRFNPEGKITRAEFAALLNRALKLPEPASKPTFTDVRPTDWFYQDVNRTYGAEIIMGKSTTRFAPNDLVTREEVVCMLMRALRYKGVDLNEEAAPVKFLDSLSISDWALQDVQLAASNQLVAGIPYKSGVIFKPRGQATRAEGAVFIKRLNDRE